MEHGIPNAVLSITNEKIMGGASQWNKSDLVT